MLQSERLRYIPLDSSHAEGLFKLWSNPSVVQYIVCPLKVNVQQCREWIHKLLTDLEEPNVFTIFFQDDIIGIGGVPCWQKTGGDYGLYYQLSEDCWGMGFGFEIAKTLSYYAFMDCKAEKISTYAVTENSGSNHILQKLGMRLEHKRKSGFKKEKLVHDENYYTMTKREWLFLYAKQISD